ncbi:MAG: 2-hydroxyacyl-CoA dehydratase [Chloroflexi bacterium]|nr:2-hydroxyacyl-CoA dehydratase [Chloroflexota bacterium]
MTTGAKHQKWETRQLQCWDKAKEARREFEQGRVKAEERHKLLTDGRDTQIFDGFGNLQSTMTNPLGALMQAQAAPFARQCRAATECEGFGREICGYHRNVFGSMILNRDMLGGPFPRRDISIPTPAACDQHSKRGQPVADHFGIPRFQGEAPMYIGPDDPERNKVMIEHRVGELLEEIEWLEKITGRKFDDEKCKESLISNMRLNSYRTEVSALQQNIPAPLDQKSIYSFFTLGGLTRGDMKATEALWREFRDEVKWRVENHIAGVGTERYRWLEDQPPSWHFLRYYRYMERYGAVCIGSPYSLGTMGWGWREDGTYGPPKNSLELGWPMNTREEIIRANVSAFSGGGRGRDIAGRVESLVNMAKAFQVNGANLPLYRAGVGCTYASREIMMGLTQAGVNVMFYENGQPGDRTDHDENRMLDQLDHWMESQGLRKLED